VNKEQFIKVLHHYAASSVAEAQQVLSLKDSFPYSQMLHALSARVAKDHGFSTKDGELQIAAVYAADRAVLKDIMLKEYNPDVFQATPTTAVIENLMPTKTVVKENAIPADQDVAAQIMHDLEQLHTSKHNFEMMFSGAADQALPELTPSETDDKKDIAKSKKARIVELAKALEQEKAQPAVPVIKTRKKRKDNVDALIDEIASSKHEIQPESDKQKEQIEIIDQFIKIQPSISSPRDKPLPPAQEDLDTLKTGEFGDNIVSETLVEILLKQGKKDKAVEVLKKLIWKFPQKKAYFAAQIEDLRK